MLGFKVDGIPADASGRVDLVAFKEKLGDDVAAIMLTNPNTCGLFERDIIEIADALHEAGGYFYCDEANLTPLSGACGPAIWALMPCISICKTFSTPHGGGGPGSGPTVLSERLAPFAPLPYVEVGDNGLRLVENNGNAAHRPFGRMVAFHGQMGMYVRALSYMMSHGADGLRQVAEDAVLNANYVLASLKDVMSAPFDGLCMHEALFDDSFLKDTEIDTLDFRQSDD